MSPASNPIFGDYKELVTENWGKPVVKRYLNDSLLKVNEFIQYLMNHCMIIKNNNSLLIDHKWVMKFSLEVKQKFRLQEIKEN